MRINVGQWRVKPLSYIDDDHLSEQGVKLILPEILAAIRAAGNSDK